MRSWRRGRWGYGRGVEEVGMEGGGGGDEDC